MLMSTLSGSSLALAMTLVTKTFTIIILSCILGTFLGTKSLTIIFKLLVYNLDFLKTIDIDKDLNGITGEKSDKVEGNQK